MNNFTFYSPTYFVFGKDTECQTGEYVKNSGEAVFLYITAAEVSSEADSLTA